MRRRIVQHGASFLGILGCNTCLEWVWNQDTDLVLATILLGLKYLNDLQAYTTLQTHCIIQKKCTAAIVRESFSYKTDCGLKYLNKFEKVHSVILRDSERKTQVHLVVFLFFSSSSLLTAFNYDFSKVWAGWMKLKVGSGQEKKRGDWETVEDECVEVCDDSVRNDKETERETAGFTAPRPPCLDLWT